MESKSTFVTVLAWIFIVGAGFATVGSAMQVIMVSTMFSSADFNSIPEDAPAMTRFMSQNFHFFIYGFFALAIFTFVSAIALLKRKNWARKTFIVILIFGILWQVGGLIMQILMFSDSASLPNDEDFENFERMGRILFWLSLVLVFVVSGSLVWVIKKLTSQSIVTEFASRNSASSEDPGTASGLK